MKKNVLFFIMIAFTMLSLTSCYQYVEPRHVGIKVKTMGNNKGVKPELLEVGRYWIGYNWELYTYPTSITIYPFTHDSIEGSPIDESIKFQDKDGLACSVDIAISAYVNKQKVSDVFQNYGGEMIEIIKNYVRQDVCNNFISFSSKYAAEELYSTRKMEMLTYVINNVKDKYNPNGVILDDIAYKSDIRLPEKLKTAINDKIEATQLALKAEAQIQQSTAEANKMIATARGEYVRDSLKAEANILLSKSLTPLLVTHQAYERWNGQPSTYSGNGSPLPLILQSK